MKITKVSLFVASVFVFLGLPGCTDAQRGKIRAIGSSASLECYSGNKFIYKGHSTGKVSSEEQSDGYYFVDKKTGNPMEVCGNCVIIYD